MFLSHALHCHDNLAVGEAAVYDRHVSTEQKVPGSVSRIHVHPAGHKRSVKGSKVSTKDVHPAERARDSRSAKSVRKRRAAYRRVLSG